MKRSRPWKLPALAGLAGLTLLASLASLAALVSEVGPLMSIRGIGLAAPHDAKAFALLSSHGPSRRAEGEQEARRALDLSPYDNTARLRLAYAYSLSGPPEDQLAITELAKSYDLVQFDYTVAAWRIQFGLNNWDRLDPDLRHSVYGEAMAFGHAHSQDVNVIKVLQSIRDPQGRLAAALWLHALKD